MQRRMMMARRRDTAVATYTVTTTGAATHTISSFGVSAATVVDFGDGSDDTYTGTATRTHNYAGAGTWTVTISTPENVTTFDIRDNKVNLNSADIATMSNVQTAVFTTLRSGTFDSADVSDWRPTTFWLYSMPASYTIVISATGFGTWTTTNNFEMQGNGLLQAAVNAILWQLYQASLTRTATSGTINVDGTNAAPSGTFQAASACPVTAATDGKEVAYELLNDSCGAITNHWATVAITA